MTKRIIIELELADGGKVVRPDRGVGPTLADAWVGQYLDGNGEQEWLEAAAIIAPDEEGFAPAEAYTENIRVVEVDDETGERKVQWDWKATPQRPE